MSVDEYQVGQLFSVAEGSFSLVETFVQFHFQHLKTKRAVAKVSLQTF